MAAHIRVKTSWLAAPFNDANDANFRESEERSIDGVVRDTWKFPFDTLENAVGRRMLFGLGKQHVNSQTLRCYPEMVLPACDHEEIEKLSIRLFSHIIII
ncbi:MAG: hypothetical protein AMJ92_02455 [candidate division Zixibacteria bacterium SM23_81]|nr:MAG: hypothetical protein AMJ92_02455 [candidate division Zixibacteria bacterium SM23_81]